MRLPTIWVVLNHDLSNAKAHDYELPVDSLANQSLGNICMKENGYQGFNLSSSIRAA